MDISTPGSTKGSNRSVAYLSFRTEELPGKFVKSALKVGEGDALVHGQPLHLVEVPLVGGVGGLVPVALAGDDHAPPAAACFLHPGCMGEV